MIDNATDLYLERLTDVLRSRKGEEQAITIDDLCRAIGLVVVDRQTYLPRPDRRTCEMLLEENFGTLGFLIVSSAHGLFRPAKADEINRYMASLESRNRAVFRRRWIIKRLAPAEGFHRAGKQFSDPPCMVQGDLFNNHPRSQP